MKPGDFNINRLVKMVFAQYPSQKRSDVVRALKSCPDGDWVSDNYICFLDPLRNGDEWNFKERVIIKVYAKGRIYIDVMKDGRVGGIEFDVR